MPAIHAAHGVQSDLLSRESVVEDFEGEIWDGQVLVFGVAGHPAANLCYAWEIDGNVTAILGVPPIDSPQAAVRAGISAERRRLMRVRATPPVDVRRRRS